MSGVRYYTPNPFEVDPTGVPYAAGQLFFYVTGTSTPQNTYQDAGLTVPNPNPVVADSSGHYGNIFLNSTTAYKVSAFGPNPTPLVPSIPSDPQGIQLWTADPVGPAASGQDGVGFIGEIRVFSGPISAAPTNWLACYGQAISRTTYASLFVVIGTTWGAGDGTTTFNLPDFRGRIAVGLDNMGGTAANRITAGVCGVPGTTLGGAGGSQLAQQDTLTSSSSVSISDPGHLHTVGLGVATTNGGSFPIQPSGGTTTANTGTSTTGITATATTTTTSGLSGTSQNVQPSAMVNIIICYQGTATGGGGPGSGVVQIGAITPGHVAVWTADNQISDGGAPSGTGTVTSVDVSGGSTGLSTSGGPITGAGTITLAGTLNVASGGTGLGSGTSGGILGYTASGTLASSGALTNHALVLGGGAGATPSTPVGLGTATTVLHGNASGAPSFASVSLSADVSGNLPVTNLNSGTSASSTTFWRGDGTWATPAGGGGSVSSVGLSLPSFITVSGSPVTGTGTLTGTLATQSANRVFVGPTTGAAAAPTFRALVQADLPVSFAGGLTATGSTQGTAFQIAAGVNQFSTVAAATGAILVTTANGIGTVIINDGANPLSVYPVSGSNFTGLAANAAVSIAAGGSATFWQITSTQVSVR